MRIPGERVKRTRLIQTDRYVVAVNVEMVIPADDPRALASFYAAVLGWTAGAPFEGEGWGSLPWPSSSMLTVLP